MGTSLLPPSLENVGVFVLFLVWKNLGLECWPTGGLLRRANRLFGTFIPFFGTLFWLEGVPGVSQGDDWRLGLGYHADLG